MRPRLVACMMVAALAFAIVGLAPTASASMSVPVWAGGDYWVYSSSGAGGFAGLPGGILRFDVVGTDTVTVGGSSIPTYHTKLNLTYSVTVGGSTTTVTVLGDAWFRTSDLSMTKLYLSASAGIFTFATTIVFNPPPAIQWPLTANATWSVTSTVTTTTTIGSITQTNSSISSGQYSVLADTNLVVPAGSFMTTPLKRTAPGSTDYTVDYWSSATGFWVSERSFNSLGVQQGSMDLTSYKYTPINLGGLDFGLMVLVLFGVIVAVVVIAVAFVAMRRKRPPAAAPVPPGAPGYPPMPPQGPPQQPPTPPSTPP